MKKLFIIFFAFAVFCSCQNDAGGNFLQDAVRSGNAVVNVISLNNQGDTLVQLFDYTQKTVVINYKNETSTLKQDTAVAPDMRFLNKKYVLEISKNETTLSRKGKVVFRKANLSEL